MDFSAPQRRNPSDRTIGPSCLLRARFGDLAGPVAAEGPSEVGGAERTTRASHAHSLVSEDVESIRLDGPRWARSCTALVAPSVPRPARPSARAGGVAGGPCRGARRAAILRGGVGDRSQLIYTVCLVLYEGYGSVYGPRSDMSVASTHRRLGSPAPRSRPVDATGDARVDVSCRARGARARALALGIMPDRKGTAFRHAALGSPRRLHAPHLLLIRNARGVRPVCAINDCAKSTLATATPASVDAAPGVDAAPDICAERVATPTLAPLQPGGALPDPCFWSEPSNQAWVRTAAA